MIGIAIAGTETSACQSQQRGRRSHVCGGIDVHNSRQSLRQSASQHDGHGGARLEDVSTPCRPVGGEGGPTSAREPQEKAGVSISGRQTALAAAEGAHSMMEKKR